MIPLALLTVFVLTSPTRNDQASGEPRGARQALRTGPAESVHVVLIIDSMGRTQAKDPGLMPEMVRLARSSLRGPQRSCFGNFTLPCLLTAFEGQQSPFLAALNNFSASSTDAPNWLDATRDQGLRTALLSDHTLTRVYPTAWISGGNFENMGLAVRDRDAYAFDQTLKWIAAREHDIIVTHIIGTDKASHSHQPGSPEYDTAFRNADAFIGQVASALDPTRDTLLVFGDHGHGEGGHHNRDAWYLLRGPHVAPIELEIDQTSLYYLLARPHALPLPDRYEGELHWQAFDNDPREASWREVQSRHWSLGADERSREHLEAALEERATQRATKPRRELVAFIPWLLHLLLVATAIAGHFSTRRELTGGYLSFQLAWLAGVVLLQGLISPTWTAWIALAPQMFWSGLRFKGVFGLPSLALWALGAFLAGLCIPWIVRTFHVRTGVAWTILIWHAAVVVAPLLIAALHRPADGGSRWSFAALVMLGACALLPAPGVYYYAVAQNLCHVLFPAALLAIILDARPNKRFGWLLLIAFCAGLPFALVDAGGWSWHFTVHHWARLMPLALRLGLSVVCLLLAALIWARKHRFGAWVAAAFLLADGVVLLTFFEFGADRVLGFSLLALSLTGGLALLEEGGDRSRAERTRTAWQVALLLSVSFLFAWSASDGFFLKNLRLDFALRRIGEAYTEEADLARAVAGLVVLRYTLALLPAIVCAGLTLGSERLVRLGPWIILVGTFKIGAQAMQILGVAFVEVEKSSELLIQELIGMSFMVLVTAMALLAVAFYRRGLEWALGRDRV